jgi:hypothetical protein
MQLEDRMRHDDEGDPKTPRPTRGAKKGTNASEATEAVPIRKDGDHEHHRHVV